MENKQCRERQTAEEAEHRGNVKNNLELYLNDVYEKECVYTIEDEEVEFIKTGIETLVQNIVDKLLEGDTVGRLLGNRFHMFRKEDYLQKSLTEVYFHISMDSYFQQYPLIQSTRSSIIKVGSFYEGTRNGFPDEFDFIFLLYSGTEESLAEILEIPMVQYIKDTLEKNKLSFCHPPTVAKHNTCTTRRLCFDKYLQVSGPAHTLQFIYRNCDGRTRYIHVDLVAAEKIDVSKRPRSYERSENTLIKPKSFRKETLSAESFIKVFGKDGISFTETEVRFMRHILSKKHVKVYRILKYIINGHGYEEKLKNYCTNYSYTFESKLFYSSYKIKAMIIYHHDECANSGTENIGPCVIQVLEEMCKYEGINDFPQVIEHKEDYTCDIKHCLFRYLPDLAKNLKTMQSSEDTYDYKTEQITPLSKLFLDTITNVPADMISEYLLERTSLIPQTNSMDQNK